MSVSPRRWVWFTALLIWLLARPLAAAPAIPAAPVDWVTDRAGVMTPAARQSLDRRLAAYEQISGHQIIVWIDRSSELPIESFAVEAFEQWRLGRAKLDDGLGIFVMVDDRVMRVEVGYGLEPTITDLVASRVIRDVMIPAIEQGEWDFAIVGGVERLVDTIEGQPGSLPADPHGPAVEQVEDPRARMVKIIVVAILAIGFVVLLIVNPQLALMLLFFGLRGGRGGGGGGGGFGGGGGRSGGGGATGRW